MSGDMRLAPWHWPHWPTEVQEAYIAVHNAWLRRSKPLPPQCCCAYCGRPRSNEPMIPIVPQEGPWSR